MRLENTIGDAVLSCALTPENTVNLNSVARFYLVNQVIFKYHLNGSRELTRRSILRHLLDRNLLTILVDAIAIFCRKWIVSCIGGREF